ncbi:MAG TPA: mannan-binding protein [Myxococcota bacterium]|nr:mannan-binding protein [Myxococcota bacterium]
MKHLSLPLLLALGHIMVASTANSNDVPAGPIWDNQNAEEVCPGVCANQCLVWNGNWTTTIWNQQSVCGCDPSLDVGTDPILNQQDAEAKCPRVCYDVDLEWNGQWSTPAIGGPSICSCKALNC